MEALIWTRNRQECDEILMLFFRFSFLTASCGSSVCSQDVCSEPQFSTRASADVGHQLYQVLLGLLVMGLHSGLGLVVLAFPIYQTRKYIEKPTFAKTS